MSADLFDFSFSSAPLTGDDDAIVAEGNHAAYDDLKIAWVNETVAPEILQYQALIVDRLKHVIDTEQERLFSSQGAHGKGPQSLTDQIKQVETDRLRFMLSGYLRTRLKKIEQFVMNILLSNDLVSRLSEPELRFAREYVDLLAQHFEDSFLSSIPERVRSLDDTTDDANNMIDSPNLDKHVFFKITKPIGPFVVQNKHQDQIDLNTNDIVLGRYSAFKVLLDTDQGQLI